MNILIEDADSLEYFTITSIWSKNILDAKRFANTGTAFAAAKKEAIGKFNIVGYIMETKQFVNLNHGRGKGLEAVAA
ncbi:MAG TPA: hypothetical protein VNX46_04465 [Candidatus Acidoferrum sp.]|jgi:hypothetical protein|nr:hypothetical protein [Candidatus Acidoferrum sp.]